MRLTPQGALDRSETEEQRRRKHLQTLTPEERWMVQVRLNEAVIELRKKTAHLRKSPNGHQ